MKRITLCLLICLSLTATITAQESTPEACEDGFRLFDHQYLAGDPVCIPDDPQRIAPLDIVSYEFLLIHDVQPAVNSELAQRFFANTQPEWMERYTDLTQGLPDVGFPANPEVALDVEPDLIIGTAGYYDDNVYDEMARIAPMIVFEPAIDSIGQDWQPNYEFLGQALNRTDDVDAIIATYEERIAALQAALADTYDGETVSVVRAVPSDQLAIRLAGSFSGILLTDVGIAQPESQQRFYDATTGAIQINLSRESWQQVDGDYLFVYGVQPSADGTTEAQALVNSLADDPIWNTLDAVQNDQVYLADPYWHGFGVLAAHDIIDDLFRIIADTEPTVANPYAEPATPPAESTADATAPAND